MTIRSLGASTLACIPKVTVALVAVASLGGTCKPPATPVPPDAISTISFANSGDVSKFTPPNFVTNGWDQCSLGPEGDLKDKTTTTPSTVTLFSSWPREAYVYDQPIEEAASDGAGSDLFRHIQFASLPAPGTGTSFTTVTRDVPWNVLNARLLDHGGCRGVIPWTSASIIYPGGYFARLNALIFQQAETTLKSFNDSLSLTQTFGRYIPSFQRPPCDGTSNANNDDGFAIDLAYSAAWKDIGAGSVAIDASYAIGASGGWITVKRVPGADFCERGILTSFPGVTDVQTRIFAALDDTKTYVRKSLDDVAMAEAAILAKGPNLSLSSSGTTCATDSECQTPVIRASFQAALKFALGGTPAADSKAAALVAGTQNASYFCSAAPLVAAGSSGGGCYWHPFVKGADPPARQLDRADVCTGVRVARGVDIA